MKKMLYKIKQNKFLFITSISLIFVLAMTLGSAIISNTLSIIGNTKIKENSWIIYFTDVRVSTDSVEAEKDAKIVDYEKTRIEFTVNLKDPGDFYEFTVYTVNDGTIDAMVKSVEKSVLTEEQQKYLEFDVTYDNGTPIRECDELNAGTRKRIKGIVKFKDGVDVSDYPKEDLTLNLFFNINYVQKEDACPPREIEDQNVLTIIPNGGKYNNRSDEVRIYLDKGEEYTVLDPTRNLYNFDGWTVTTPEENGTYSFENGKFVMGDEDVTITANWIEGEYVARIMNKYYPTIQQAFDEAKKADWDDNTVWLLRDTTEYPVNNTSDSFVFNLDGHTVTGTITNSANGDITLVNGRVVAEEGHTEAFINNGVLKLGIDDNSVHVENYISLIGNEVGLRNTEGSKFYFYDGYIEGISGLVGGYTDKASGYYVFVGHNSERDCQRVYLIKNPSRAVVKTVTKGDLYYYNLQDAIKSIELNKQIEPNLTDNDYIAYALRDFEAAYELSIDSNARVFFDLSGYSVATGEKFNNEGFLKVFNTKTTAASLKTSFAITNTGSLEIDNISLISTTSSATVENSGSFKVTDSIIEGSNGYGVENINKGTMDIDSNTLIKSGNGYGIYNSGDSLIINDGTIIGIYNEGTMTIDENVIVQKRPDVINSLYYYGVYNFGTFNMNNGTISSIEGDTLINNQGTFNFNNGSITAQNTAINNRSVFNANGGIISSTNIVAYNSGTFNAKGTEIKSTTKNTISNSGTVNVYDGDIVTNNGVAISGSTVKVYGGEVIGTTYGVQCQSFTISGGLVKSDDIAVRAESLYNSGNASINGGEIIGKTTGLYADNVTMSAGTVIGEEENGITYEINGTITGGTVKGAIYGVYTGGTLTIGEDEGEISITSPTLMGGSYGLYTTGSVTNFYDGILKGQVDGYYGKITKTPLGAVSVEGEETIDDNLYQTDFLLVYENWLRVGDKEFNTLNAASEYIEGEGTIEVIKDANITYTQQVIDVNKDKKITLDLNGYNVITTQTITNDSDLTIKDSSTNGTGTITFTKYDGIVNNNKLTIESGNYSTTSENLIIGNDDSIITITGGNFTASVNVINSSGEVTFDGGNIVSSKVGIRTTGSVTMNSGTINSTSSGISTGYVASKIVINGGTINSNDKGINSTDASVTMNDGQINALNGAGIYVHTGNLYMNGGTVTSTNYYGAHIYRDMVFNGGTITGTVGIRNDMWCNLYICYSGTITFNDGLAVGTSTYGIHLHVGDLIFNGGTAQGEVDGVFTDSTTVIQLGSDDKNVSITNPVLIGKRYGLNTNGYSMFNDGVLKGIEAAHNGLISLIPDGSLIKDDFEYIDKVEYKTQYIVEKGNWLRVGEQEFNSLNAASDAIDQEGTIYVIADAYVDFEQGLPSNKTITLDLNGHSLITTQPLKTQGNVTITDSVGNGSIHNLRDITIRASGTLKIEGGTFSSDTNVALSSSANLTIEGGTFIANEYYAASLSGNIVINDGEFLSSELYGIYNSGNLTFNGGNVNSSKGINNYGTLEINNGTITGIDGVAINTVGKVTINNGTITSKNTNSAISVISKTTTINGGNITSEGGDAIYISSSTTYGLGHLVVNSGIINGFNNGIANNNINNTITINDGNIIGQTAVGLKSVGKTNILGGVIEGGTYGVQVSDGTTNIGTDDGTINIDAPILKGELFGLYITGGTINFSDGILKGVTQADYGQITNIPERAEIFEDEEVIDGVTYDVKYLVRETDIAVNLQTNKIYSNLQDSINEAQEGETVQLLTNVPLYYELTNSNTASFTLDLNGYTISTNKKIVNKGNLTIVNSSENEASIRTASSINLITNTNILNINNVTLKNNSASNYVIANSNQLNINNVKIDCINGIQNTSNLISTNSTITSSKTAINNTGKLDIEGGVYTGTDYSLYSNSSNNVTIKDATLNGTYYNNGNNVVNVSNCTINGNIQNNKSNLTIDVSNINGSVSNNGVWVSNKCNINGSITNSGTLTTNENNIIGGIGGTINNSGTMTMNSSIFKTSSYHSYIRTEFAAINNTSNMIINDSSIYSDTDDSYRYYIIALKNSGKLEFKNGSNIYIGMYEKTAGTYTGIKTISSGETIITDSSIYVNGSSTAYGVYTADNDSNITLETGLIEVRSKGTTYGAYINLGTFTMGHNEGTGVESEAVSTENPKIYSAGTSRGIGVKKINGYFNFYDGVLWASRYTKPETTSNVEYNYEVTTYVDEETGFEYAWLEYMKNDYLGSDSVASIEGTFYKTMQDAVDKVEPGQEIKLLKSISEDFIVSLGDDVKINLNGHSITTQVVNNGTLNIYNGSLQNFENTTIINNGTFIMGENDGKVSSTSVRVVSETTTIENNGTFIMYDGYIEGVNPALVGDIDEIAEFSRIYTMKDSQSERKYLQSLSEEAIKNKETDLILTIDPANGVYNNSKEKQEVYLKYEDTYELLTPTKNGCIFLGWEVSDESVLNDSTITMNLSDVNVKALWEVSDDAVAKIDDEYFTSVSDAIEYAKEGDTIVILKDVEENVTNTKDITIDLGGNTIFGEFINGGILKLINGTIENPNGIGLVNNKSLTLGENDGEIKIEDIKIIGTTLGLEQNGKFNFYDGYLEGEVALHGTTDSVPKGYFLYNEHNDLKDCQRVYLIGNPQNAVAVINAGQTQYFFSLQDAINTASVTGNEIFIVRDFEATYPVTVNEDTDIIINMNSYNITTGNNIINNGNLKIYDTSETVGSITSAKTIENNGNLVIEKVSINESNTTNNAINNYGDLKLYNTTITAKDGAAVYTEGTFSMDSNSSLIANTQSLHNNQTETLVLNGGTITAIRNSTSLEINEGTIISNTVGKTGIYMDTASASTVMNGGSIDTTYVGVVQASNNQTFIMNGGTITSTNLAITMEGTGGSVVINKGTITSTDNIGIRLYTEDNSLEINDVNLTSKGHAIYVRRYRNTININGGEIISTNDYGIHFDYGTSNTSYFSTVNIKNAKIKGYEYGARIHSANFNIENSELSNTYTTNYSSLYCSSYSVCNIGEGSKIGTPELYMGIYVSDHSTLNVNGGKISGNNSGIYVYYGTVNINDGRIYTEKSNSTGVYVVAYNNTTVNMNGGSIESSHIGIQLNNANNYSYTNKLNVNGGRISGDTYGIYQNCHYSTVTVGTKDKELSTEIPYVTGGLYGLYNNSGTVNFYNGRLRGYTYGYYGTITNMPSGMEITEVSEFNTEEESYFTYSTTNNSSEPISEYAKLGDGHVRLTYIGETNSVCTNGQEFNYEYTGIEEIFVAPCQGKYKLEAWGAQGGGSFGGKGGYSKGNITLALNETLYINVGGQGGLNSGVTNGTGGYNGGGAGGLGSSNCAGGTGGGGATHVATSSGILSSLEDNKSSVIIVAGGGGGSVANGWNSYYGGSGGGYKGGDGQVYSSGSSTGGTQTKGYKFGEGEAGRDGNGKSYGAEGNGGSGGGYYGGSSVRSNASYTNSSGAGGSGYIGHSRLTDRVMYGYNVPATIETWISNYLVEKEHFLQVGDKTYNSLNLAQAAIEENGSGTIILIKDAELNELSTLDANKNITFDLNGHTLINTSWIDNYADLTIIDSSSEKTGLYYSMINDSFVNYGNITMDGISVKSAKSTVYAPTSSGTGTVTIKDTKSENDTYFAYISSAQTVNVESSDITTGNNSFVATVDYVKFNISDSSINSSYRGISIVSVSYCDVNISNTNINSTDVSLYLDRYGHNVEITDSNFKSTNSYTIYKSYSSNKPTTMNVTNSTFESAKYHTIYSHGINFNMTGGEIKNTYNSGSGYYAFNSGSDNTYSKATLTDVKINSEYGSGIYASKDITLNNTLVNAPIYGIYINNGTVTMNGDSKINTTASNSSSIYIGDSYNVSFIMNDGEINSANIGINNASTNNSYTRNINIYGGKVIGNTYGISQTTSTGNITIGKEDSDLSTTEPYITGGEYGIYHTSGTVYFYNGRLRGRYFGYNDEFNGLRKGKKVYTEYEFIDDENPFTISVNSSSKTATENTAKEGNGYAKLTYIGESTDTCTKNQVYEFDYTNDEQIFDVPCQGEYKVEVWGAEGGLAICNSSLCGTPGKGGYSKGIITLEENEKLYINVGGQGSYGTLTSCSLGGYNGGGAGTNDSGSCDTASDDEAAGAGGGATHIATTSGLLSSLEQNKESIIIVAAGGGGAAWTKTSGSGGGYAGGTTESTSTNYPTQETGYAFGQGQDGEGAGDSTGVAGAGGGFYGGYSNNSTTAYASTGGSGYISNDRLTNGVMYGYHVLSNTYANNYLVEKDGFLQVGDKIYNSFNDAVLDIEETGTVVVINNGTLQEEPIVPEGKNITLDLNGQKMTTTRAFQNYGNFTIVDSSLDKSGIIDNIKSTTITNRNSLQLDNVTLKSVDNVIYGGYSSGTISVTDSTLYGATGVYLDNEQTLTVNNSHIEGTNIGIRLQNNKSHLIVDKGTIIGNNHGIYIYGSSSSLNISGAKIISSSSSGIYDDRSSVNTINIEGSEIIGKTHGIRLYCANLKTNSTIITTNTTNKDEYAIYNNCSAGTIELNEGTILNAKNGSGLYNYRLDTTLNGATINVDTYNGYGIYHYGGNLDILNSSTINTTGYSSYGIYSYTYATTTNFENSTINSGNIGVLVSNTNDYKKTFNVKSGTIKGKTYGISLDKNNAVLNVGSQDDDLSITNPYIEGGLYSIYQTTGTMNFYSGLLKGYISAYYGTFNNIREGHEIFEDFDSTESYLIKNKTYTTTNISSDAISNSAKEGNGYAKLTYIENTTIENNEQLITEIDCDNMVGNIYEFTSIKNVQQFVAQCPGKYKLEVWGAQGGYRSNEANGGKGGYTSGEINLLNNETLYIYVGSSGNNGGYNGGGTRSIGYGGGGATDIRFGEDLYSRVIVAGGGGSDGATSRPGGAGGGLTGQSRTENYGSGGNGGTQGAGGLYRGTFGLGGSGLSQNNGYGGAGGGGWYGGGGVNPDGSSDDDRGGGGGSSFAYTELVILPSSYNVDKKYMLSNVEMYSGLEAMPDKFGITTTVGNLGDGYARITYLENNSVNGSDNVTVTLIGNEGTVVNNILTYKKGDKLGTLEIPSANGEYQFVGWYVDSDFTKKVNEDTIINTNVVLYAKYIYNDDYCMSLINTEYNFDYTGNEQIFNVKCPGKYKLEVWGAQGGDATYEANSYHGGYGGYTTGEIDLYYGEKLNIKVGGKGTSILYKPSESISEFDSSTGYNGGGYAAVDTNNSVHGGGGGATSITSYYKGINETIIIAGGGGGASAHQSAPNYSGNGGSGGGATGGSGEPASTTCYNYGTGGSQISAGSYTACSVDGRTDRGGYVTDINAGLGIGANYSSNMTGSNYSYSGGGGGYYGGQSAWHAPGGGGSGYVANSRISNNAMYGYNVLEQYTNDDSNIAYLIEAKDFIINTTQNTSYSNLQTALDSSDAGDILQLTQDYTISYAISYASDSNITLDLNGYDLKFTKTITNSGNLTITNTSEVNESSLLSPVSITLITNDGTLNVNNLNVDTASKFVLNNDTLNIDNCVITGNNTIENNTGGVLSVNNSTITGTNQALYNRGGMTITSTSINGTNYALYNNSTGTSTIKDSKLISSSNALYNYTSGLITLEDCESTGSISNNNANGTLNIIGGTLVGNMYNNGKSTIRNTIYTHTNTTYHDVYMFENRGVMTLENNNITYTDKYNGSYDYNTEIVRNTGTLTSYDNEMKLARESTSAGKELFGLYNKDGIMTSNGDIIELSNGKKQYVVYNNSTNDSEVNNIIIKSHNSTEYDYGIYNASGNLTVNSGSVTMYDSNESKGIYSRDVGAITISTNVDYTIYNVVNAFGGYAKEGTLIIETGTLSAKGTTTAYGVSIETGTLTLGTFDGRGTDSSDMSTTDPLLEAIAETAIGVSMNNGSFNYYDGKIVGSTSPRAEGDIITSTETNYQVVTRLDEETGYNYCILEFIK